jgi:uracil-DNA glycosylase family protein
VPTAERFVPRDSTLPELRAAAAGCQGCELWKLGTHTVFGEGPPDASVMLVGEQPGDEEDREGRPFVGRAGKILDRALEAAGIDRSKIYVTNAVKHFKWEPGRRHRVGVKPAVREVVACRPWLDAEMSLVRPNVIVCLGATAAQALLGKSFRVTQQRGEFVDSPLAPRVMATVHPSAILRNRSVEMKRVQMAWLVADLRKAALYAARGRHKG